MGENHHAHTFGFTNHSNQIDKGSCVPVCAALLQPFLLLLFCRHVRIRSPWGYLHRARLLPRRRPRSRPMLQCSCCHCGRRLFRASPVGSFLAHPQLARGSSDVSHAVFQFLVPCGTSAAYRLYLKRGRNLCRGKISSGTISWAAVLAPCDMMMPFLGRDTRDHVVRFTSRCYVTDYVTVKGITF